MVRRSSPLKHSLFSPSQLRSTERNGFADSTLAKMDENRQASLESLTSMGNEHFEGRGQNVQGKDERRDEEETGEKKEGEADIKRRSEERR